MIKKPILCDFAVDITGKSSHHLIDFRVPQSNFNLYGSYEPHKTQLWLNEDKALISDQTLIKRQRSGVNQARSRRKIKTLVRGPGCEDWSCWTATKRKLHNRPPTGEEHTYHFATCTWLCKNHWRTLKRIEWCCKHCFLLCYNECWFAELNPTKKPWEAKPAAFVFHRSIGNTSRRVYSKQKTNILSD